MYENSIMIAIGEDDISPSKDAMSDFEAYVERVNPRVTARESERYKEYLVIGSDYKKTFPLE